MLRPQQSTSSRASGSVIARKQFGKQARRISFTPKALFNLLKSTPADEAGKTTGLFFKSPKNVSDFRKGREALRDCNRKVRLRVNLYRCIMNHQSRKWGKEDGIRYSEPRFALLASPNHSSLPEPWPQKKENGYVGAPSE